MTTANYQPGQILTAAELNASLNGKADSTNTVITGGQIEGLDHLFITGTAVSTNPTTGALTVAGGAGVAGDISGGGKIRAASDITSGGNVTGVNGSFSGTLTAAQRILAINSTNLLPNSSGEFGNIGWSSSAFAAGVGTAGQGPIFMNGSLINVATQDGQQVAISAGVALVISAEALASGVVAGRPYVSVEAFNSSNASLGVIALAAQTPGANGFVTASGTTPANTAYVKVWKGVDTSPNVPVGGLIFRRIKLEVGTTASLYSQEASIAATSGNANGELTINGALGSVTLTADQFTNAIFKVTGTLTGNIIITVPATPHSFVVQNLTSGLFTVTFKAVGQTPNASIVQGKAATLFSDATGVYATSSAAGLSFAGLIPFSGNQTLGITQMGSMVTQSAASVTTFPKANTVQAGTGFGFANVDAVATDVVQLAIQAGDTVDLPFPFNTQPNDVFFWYSDGVSKWKLGWYSNEYTPQFQTSVRAPKLLAGQADNGTDVIQGAGSVAAQSAQGTLRLTPQAVSTPAAVTSSALGLDLLAAGATAMRFFTNAVERFRIFVSGRVGINTTTDNGVDQLQVNGSIQTSVGIKFPDGTTQTSATGGTAGTTTVYSIANGNVTLGATAIVTGGFVNPFCVIFRNGLKLTLGVDYTLAGDNKTVNLTNPVAALDNFEVQTGFTYNPSTVYVPSSTLLTPAFGATSVPFVYTPGFVYLYANGARLVGGVDYSATDGANINFLTFTGDGVTQIEVWNWIPLTPANCVSATNPILQAPLTFADGTQQGTSNPGFKNWCHNGNFQILSRGAGPFSASTNTTNMYGVDRWAVFRSTFAGGYTFTSAPAISLLAQGSYYALQVQRTAGDTGVTPIFISSSFETIDVRAMAGSVMTFSVWVFGQNGFAGLPITAAMAWGTGTDGSLASGFTGQATLSSSQVNLSAGWQKVKVTATVPTNATQFAVFVSVTPTATAAGASDLFYIASAQLEFGPTATPLERLTQGQYLDRCLRYYRSSQIQQVFSGNVTSGSTYYSLAQFGVRMRANPTVVLAQQGGNSGFATAAPTLNGAGTDGILVQQNATVTAAGVYGWTFTADAELK